MTRSGLHSVIVGVVLVTATAWLSDAPAQVSLGEVVITPGGRPEPR